MNTEFLNNPITLEKLQKFAIKRGGKLISKEYINQSKLLKFKCKFNHKFSQTAGNLKWFPNIWCSECSSGLGERMTRIAFQKIFKKEFKKQIPKWLKTKENTPLELDGYNEELKLAFEHRGLQYYKNKDFFNKRWKTKGKKRYLENSKLKEKICKNKITLIIVPAVPEIIHPLKLKDFIKKKLKNSNNKHIKKCLNNIDNLQIDYSMAYKFSHLDTLKKIAKQNEGKVISKFFMGYMIPHKFQCKYKHKIFENTPRMIIERKQWCPNMICVEEKRKANLIEKYPEYKFIINRAKNSTQAAFLILKDKDPDHFHNLQLRKNPLTKKNQNKYTTNLAKILKNKQARIIDQPKILQSKTRLKIICKRGHDYNPMLQKILAGRWCRKCWKIESK
tara:strand:- start:1238 stop:2407 length:1170 start_codon:yes stop_codon:yes gene_type:complete